MVRFMIVPKHTYMEKTRGADTIDRLLLPVQEAIFVSYKYFFFQMK